MPRLLFLGLALAALVLGIAAPPLAADGGGGEHPGEHTFRSDHDDDDDHRRQRSKSGRTGRGEHTLRSDRDHDDDEPRRDRSKSGRSGRAEHTFRADHDHDDHRRQRSKSGRIVRLQTVGPAARGTPSVRYVPGELLVRFRSGTSTSQMRAAARRAGGTLGDPVSKLGLRIVRVPPGREQRVLASLRSEPSVLTVERDLFLEGLDTIPNDQLWPTQWGARLVGEPRAWDSTRGSSGVAIAVLDTGVDATHPDLVGATVAGRDLVNDDADASDDEGHGTGVAGVIGSRTNNREGQSGVCWVCALMPVKVLDSTGSGKTSTIAIGIVWAVDHGARVLNMSLGGPGTTSALRAAVGYASSKGVVQVAAAGNSGVDTPFYPAAYSEVIGVAATTDSDSRYSWSNYGTWVPVAAPGCNTAPRLGGGYVEFCGTSSAAPIVSGIAGLAFSLNSSASGTEVEQAITRTATPVPGTARFGRVNAPTVMSAVGSTGSSTPLQSPPPPPSAAPPPAPPPPPPPTSPPAAVTAPPANLQRPRLHGLARMGRALRVTRGAWSANPSRFAYAWRRCAPNGARCRTITNAQKPSYRLTRRDRGHRMRAAVVAVNATGAGSAVTAASSIVRVARARR